MAKPRKWIAPAIARPGALRKKMGAKDGIPTSQLQAKRAQLSKKAEGEKKLSASDLRTLRQVNLALTLRGPKVGTRKKK